MRTIEYLDEPQCRSYEIAYSYILTVVFFGGGTGHSEHHLLMEF